MSAHHTTVIWVRNCLVIQIRPPEPHFSGCIWRLHALQITQIVLIGGEDVGEADKV